MRSLRRVVLVVVCLGITGSRVGWAEPAHEAMHASWIEDGYAPHRTSGTELRLGSIVGFLHGEPFKVFAIGATVAAGQRFGRFTVEANFDWMALQTSVTAGNGIRIGDAERLGLVGRFDVLRLGPRWIGRNSMMALYVEGGAAAAWNHWYQPRFNEPMRIVPDDTKRIEGQAGFGVLLEHRRQEPTGFPRRIGWFLGWRFGLLPPEMEPEPVCRTAGTVCRVSQPVPEDDQPLERSMTFQSSLAITW